MRKPQNGNGLIGALLYHGLDAIDVQRKDSMRDLALRGGTWTEEERLLLLEYCESDVVSTAHLFEKMEPEISINHALLRGEYMKAVSGMEAVGIPIDGALYCRIAAHLPEIRAALIADIDQDFRVYEGATFKQRNFDNWLLQRGITWPRLPSGDLDLKKETFKEMALLFPAIAPLKDLRGFLSALRTPSLAIGADDRNRVLLSPFKSITGRNQPSTSRFVFGMPSSLRALIKPHPGYSLAYIDYEQQEFGIAAALANDENMKHSYASGDPYLEFGKLAKAVPADATKATHKHERDLFKKCVLATQYGMSAYGLARSIDRPIPYAEQLLRDHRRVFHRFWNWSDSVLEYALLHRRLWTVFGWELHLIGKINERSVRNFPMQANGAEMLRLACIYGDQHGISICAPVHDALLIEARTEDIEEAVQITRDCMAQASAAVLSGFVLRTEAKVVHYPERLGDENAPMWRKLMNALQECQGGTVE
jgi:DNA polymerase-1